MSAAPAVARPVAETTNPLRQRLGALRRRYRLVTAFRGACWPLAIILAVGCFVGILDYCVSLPALVRAIGLTATLAGSGLLAFFYLLKPLVARYDDLTLALKIEERYPTLNDALASTVEFLDRTDAAGDSPSLRREAVRRALERAKNCDFNKIIPSANLKLAGMTAGLSALLTAALFWSSPDLSTTAAIRFIDPFGDHSWTHLSVGVPEQIGQGDNYDVTGTLSGVLPQEVTILLRPENSKTKEWERQTVAAALDEGQGVFSLSIKNVQRDFRFRVIAGDAQSPVRLVKVLAPPFLVNNSLEVEIQPPAYSGKTASEKRKPGTTLPGEGSSSSQAYLEADAGSKFTVRGEVDQPLRTARLEYYQPEALKMLGGGLILAPGGSSLLVPVNLAEDRKHFTVAFQPRTEGRYRLVFENELGLAGRQYFEVRLKPDPAPVVRMERPSQTKDNLNVLPTAVLTLHVVAHDPVFGMRSVYLRYRTGREQQIRTVQLFDPDTAAGLPGLVAGPGIMTAKGLRVAPEHLEFKQPLPIKLFTRPDGTPLQNGDVLILQVCADDHDDITPDKQPGTSEQVEIHIVDRNALELALNQEQTRIQQQLARANDEQKQASQQIHDAEQKLKNNEPLNKEERDSVIQAQQKQQDVKNQITDEKDGLKARVDRLRETVKQNELESGGLKEKMDHVARELDRLNKEITEKINPALASAAERTELQDPQNRETRKAMMEERSREAERQAQQKNKQAEEREKQARQADGATRQQLQQQAENLRREAEEQKARAEEARRNAADLDNKSAEQRRAAAEERSRELEKQADAKNKEAEERQKQAEQAKTPDEKKRLQAETRELKKQADQLQKQAEKTRREAEPAFQRELREKLTEAQRGQTEVEKTFSELMQDLEVGANSREVKSDARSLLEDQKKLQAKLKEFEERNQSTGADPKTMTPEQKQELETMRSSQQKLEERTKQLLDKMQKLAEERRKENDVETANGLADARKEAEERHLADEMKKAADEIKENKLANAQKTQQKTIEGMEKMVKDLDQHREAELERHTKKLEEAKQKLEELQREEEELQKKIKEAEKIADPEKRREALQELEGQQRKMKQKAQELAQELKRLRANRAAQAMEKAADDMELKRQKLEEGKKPDVPELDRLEDARQEIQRAQKEKEAELRREQLRRVADALARVKERQETLTAEATRIQQEVQKNMQWGRTLRSSLKQLIENQNGLGDEARNVAEKELGGTPVFRKLVEKSTEAMKDAADRLKELDEEQPEPAKLPDGKTAQLQGEALRRLVQVLNAIKDEMNELQKQQGGGGEPPEGGEGGDGGGGGAGGGPQDNGLPPMAQIKLLRDLQVEVKNNTQEFRKEFPDVDNLDAKGKARLETLRKDQQDIIDLFEEMRRPPGEQPDGPGEKKQDAEGEKKP